ncbi:MAG: acyl carrier protein [Ignavibacteria bacterium]
MLSESEIMDQLVAVFREFFHNDRLEISAATTAKDVEGWDSLMHMNLILGVEKHFKVKFKLGEIVMMNNVGDLCALVQKHQK